MHAQWDAVTERRRPGDRRQQGILGLNALFNQRRRKLVRRACDRRKLVVLDQYGRSTLMLVVLILVLSLADAFFTLFLVGAGATELNPVMDYYLKQGSFHFVLVKYLLTAVSVVFIVILSHVFIPRFRLLIGDLLKLFAGGFAALISWEVLLVFRFVI
ncbi:MAG: hypothetical protein HKP58_13835 [Desulfatitalea sp.]|nr:hypothetical protein [Desulfatitalea sp.]NNK01483.1 hypothetical protein [Desulfatitalea sp.]